MIGLFCTFFWFQFIHDFWGAKLLRIKKINLLLPEKWIIGSQSPQVKGDWAITWPEGINSVQVELLNAFNSRVSFTFTLFPTIIASWSSSRFSISFPVASRAGPFPVRELHTLGNNFTHIHKHAPPPNVFKTTEPSVKKKGWARKGVTLITNLCPNAHLLLCSLVLQFLSSGGTKKSL